MLSTRTLYLPRVMRLAFCCALTCGFAWSPTQARQTAALQSVTVARHTRPRRVHPLPADTPDRLPDGTTNHGSPALSSGSNQTAGRSVLNFFRATEVRGFIDVYYSFNFNRPYDKVNVGRNFDTQHNRFRLNLAEWTFEKKPDADKSRLGFRFDVDFGTARDLINAAEPGRNKAYSLFQQAYGSYLAPVGSGLQIDAGKFITWIGAEVNNTKDNWNYSRGLLFVYAQPGYHLGARAQYAFNDKVSVLGAVVNGWNNVEENNRGKSYGFSVALTPTKKLSLTQGYIGGAEQPDDTRHKRHLFDTILNYNFNERLSFQSNYDYGFDTLTDGSRVRWQGVSVSARYAFTPRVAVSPRVEWFNDYDGFTTGTPQRLREATLTGDYRVFNDLLLRFEVRRDESNQPFFTERNPLILRRQQTTVLGGLIYTFSTRLTTVRVPDNPAPEPPPDKTAQP